MPSATFPLAHDVALAIDLASRDGVELDWPDGALTVTVTADLETCKQIEADINRVHLASDDTTFRNACANGIAHVVVAVMRVREPNLVQLQIQKDGMTQGGRGD